MTATMTTTAMIEVREGHPTYHLRVTTYNPTKYLLVNVEDGTVWRGDKDSWKDSGLYLDEENQLLKRDP